MPEANRLYEMDIGLFLSRAEAGLSHVALEIGPRGADPDLGLPREAVLAAYTFMAGVTARVAGQIASEINEALDLFELDRPPSSKDTCFVKFCNVVLPSAAYDDDDPLFAYVMLPVSAGDPTMWKQRAEHLTRQVMAADTDAYTRAAVGGRQPGTVSHKAVKPTQPAESLANSKERTN